MTTVNVLVTTDQLEPGDHGTDHGGNILVVYANEVVNDYERDIKMINIKDGLCRPIKVRHLNQTRWVMDRPSSVVV